MASNDIPAPEPDDNFGVTRVRRMERNRSKRQRGRNVRQPYQYARTQLMYFWKPSASDDAARLTWRELSRGV